MPFLQLLAATLLAACLATTAMARGPHAATGQKFAVATVQPLATDAAMAVFREGGNAVDAAVCAALTLSVVDNHNSGIGGGCLILVRTPEGELIAIDGRETAPATATADMFLCDGVADTSLSQVGPLAVATPGALAAYAALLEEAGSMPLSRLLQPGLKAAAEGFPIDSNYARRLDSASGHLARFPGSKAQFLSAAGEPLKAGETLKQPDLAATYQGVADHGIDYFYRGPFAERVGEWMAENGGRLTASDFAAYEAKRREPIVSHYRGNTIVGFPPPSSGGIHIAQMLGMLERFDLAAVWNNDKAEAVHLVTEAMKLAFADRAFWLGDADFVDVPRGLIDPDYIASLGEKIDPAVSTPVDKHGTPPQWAQDLFGRHTTHIAAADAEGYWVSITATVNTGFGSKVVVPGTGVVLNNEMDDFAAAPGTPNAFGLLGAANNAVAPGKRPLSSMSPTLVLDAEGEPLMALGAAGGPKIITQVLLNALATIDGGRTIAEALAQPRWHHQWRPDTLLVEEAMPAEVVAELEARGHQIKRLEKMGVSQAIALRPDGSLMSAADPRVPGKASAE